MTNLIIPPQKIAASMSGSGWRHHGRDGRMRHSQGRKLTVKSVPEPRWLRYDSAPINLPSGANFMDLSAQPRGPFKFVPAEAPQTVRLLADVPVDVDAATGGPSRPAPLPQSFLDEDGPLHSAEAFGAGQVMEDNAAIWAQMFNRAVGISTTKTPISAPGKRPSDNELAERLTRAGFQATPASKGVNVRFEGRRPYTQALVYVADKGNYRIDVKLASIGGWERTSRQALSRVAAEANERLRLVRLVRRGEAEEEEVLAQVDLGALGQSAWLEVALDAVRAATSVLASEIPLLKDAQLASWIVTESVSTTRRS